MFFGRVDYKLCWIGFEMNASCNGKQKEQRLAGFVIRVDRESIATYDHK